MILEKIKKPNDIHKVSLEDFPRLAEEIRSFLIQSVSETGGHLASNLGVVELTLALHNAVSYTHLDVYKRQNKIRIMKMK